MNAAPVTVWRFAPSIAGSREGRIALDITARTARRQYRRWRATGTVRIEARGRIIHLFAKAVEP